MKGKVKFFNRSKGFGFISGEDEKEYFVHQTGLKEGVSLNENDEVTFKVEQGDRGPKAVDVSKAGGKAAEEEETVEESEETSEEESEESEETEE